MGIRKFWRFVKWSIIGIALLVVVMVVAAIAGVGGRLKIIEGTTTQMPLRVYDTGSNAVRVVGPNRLIPLHRVAPVGDGWKLRVMSVTRNGAGFVHTYYGPKAPPGAQDVVVALALTYVGGGKSSLRLFSDRINVIGSHRTPYNLNAGNGCGPGRVKLSAPDLQKQIDRYIQVFSGQSVKGRVCFQVAKNDVMSLRLYVLGPYVSATDLTGKRKPSVWFALR